LVAQAAPYSTDYLAWTKADGTEEYRAIGSTNASGVITLSVAFSAAPAEGDPIRVTTAETKRAFPYGNARWISAVGPPVRLYSAVGAVGEYRRSSFEVRPSIGRIIPVQGRHYTTAEGVYPSSASFPLYYFDETLGSGYTNTAKIEAAFANLVSNVIPSADFVAGNPTGGFFTEVRAVGEDLDTLLSRLSEQGLPGNAFLHDRPDGKIGLGSYYQKDAPDLVLGNISDAEITAEDSPYTSCVVIAKQEPRNIASLLKPATSSGWTNPERLFDGSRNNAATCTNGSTVTFTFDINPVDLVPYIDAIKIHGTVGYFTAQLFAIARSTGSTFQPVMIGSPHYIGIDPGSENVIGQDLLLEAIRSLGVGSWVDNQYYFVLTLTFYSDDSTGVAVVPSLTEIEVITSTLGGWAAKLTDDTTGSPPTGWSSVAVGGNTGSVWWQRIQVANSSYRFIASDVAKRILANYSSVYTNQRHRTKVITLSGINGDEARDMAELYMDELIRGSARYSVRAVLDPRVDLGDTVAVTLGDGSPRLLFVWGIADGGKADSREATYTLMDYAS